MYYIAFPQLFVGVPVLGHLDISFIVVLSSTTCLWSGKMCASQYKPNTLCREMPDTQKAVNTWFSIEMPDQTTSYCHSTSETTSTMACFVLCSIFIGIVLLKFYYNGTITPLFFSFLSSCIKCFSFLRLRTWYGTGFPYFFGLFLLESVTFFNVLTQVDQFPRS